MAKVKTEKKAAKGKKTKRFSRKKKLLFIGIPILTLVALVAVFFLYQLSRSYQEPDDLLLNAGTSDMMPKPETGTPADYTPQENAAISLYVLTHTENYRTEMEGQVKAAVGFINYDQSVKNVKVVDGDDMFTQALSLSSLVKVGEQKFFRSGNGEGEQGIYLLRPADNVESAESVNWSDEISAMSPEAYEKRYGMVNDGLSNYIMSKDTITSAEFVGESDGKYTFNYELDPDKSSAYYRRQVKTLSGSDKIPLFHSVHMTVVMDKDWQPLEVTINENYDISMPVIGMANCDGTLTETFLDYGVKTEIPDYAKYDTYIKEEYDPNNLKEFSDGGDTDIMGYISKMFDTDKDGKATLAIDFTLNNGAPQRAYVEVDTKNNAFKLKWDNLLIGYQNSRIYLSMGNIKYYLEQDDLLSSLQTLSKQLGFELPSMDQLMSKETMDALMKNLQMGEEDGKTKINFKMDGIDAKITMTGGGEMKFIDANIGINLDGFQATISAKQAPTQNMPAFDDSYQNMGSVLEFAGPIINLVNAKTYAFTVDLDMAGDVNLKQTAQVRLIRSGGGVNAQIDSNIGGKWLRVKVIDGDAYISYGKLRFLMHTDDMNAITEELKKIIPENGLDLSAILPQAYLDLVNNLDVNALINSIQSLDLTDDTLTLNLKIGADTISMNVTKAGDQLSSAYVRGVTVMNSKVNVTARLDAISNYASVILLNPMGYTDLKDLVGFVGPVVELLNASTYEFDARINLEGDLNLDQTARVKLVRDGNNVNAQVTAKLLDRDLTVKLIKGVTYLDYGNVKLKLDTKDLPDLIGQIQKAVPEMGDLDVSKVLPQSYLDMFQPLDVVKLLDGIESIRIGGDQLGITLKVGEDRITLSVKKAGSSLKSADLSGLTVFNSKLNAGLTLVGTSKEKQAIAVNDAGYTDIKAFMGFVDPVMELVNGSTYDLDLSANLTGKLNWTQNANLKVVRTEKGANLELTAPISGTNLLVKYIDGKAYVQYGNIKLKLDTNDIEEISKNIQEILPEDTADFDLSQILPQAYVDLFTEMDLGKLLDSIQGLTANGDEATLTLQIGSDTIQMKLKKNGKSLQSVSLSGLTVMESKVTVTASLKSVSKTAAPITVNDAEFADVKEIMEFIPILSDLLSAKTFEVEANVKLTGDLPLNQTVNCKLVRTDDNGVNLELNTRLDGQMLNLRFVDRVVYVQYGNVKLRLDTTDLDEIMAAVQEILPESMQNLDLAGLIPEQYRTLLENPDIPKLLQLVKSLTIKHGVLQLSVQLGDEPITLSVAKDGSVLSGLQNLTAASTGDAGLAATNHMNTLTGEAADAKASLPGISVNGNDFALTAILKKASPEVETISTDSTGYLDVKELLPFLKPVASAVNATSYAMDFQVDLLDKKGKAFMEIPASVQMERTKHGLNLNLDADVFGQSLNLKLIDSDQCYITYGDVAVKMKFKDLDSIIKTIKKILPDGVTLDLSKVLPKAYLNLFDQFSVGALVPAIRGMEVKDDTLSLTLKFGSDTVDIRVTTDGETISSAELSGITLFKKLELQAYVENVAFEEEPLDIAVENEDDYLDVQDLMAFITPLMNTINAKSWQFPTQVALGGNTYDFDVELTRTKKGGVDFSIEGDLDGAALSVKRIGSNNYVSCGNIHLLLQDADIEELTKKVKSILPDGNAVIDSFDLSSILPQEYLDLISDPDIGVLIGGIHSLTLDGDTLTLGYGLGSDSIQLSLTKGKTYLEGLSLSGINLLDSSLGVNLQAGKISNQMTTIEAPDVPLSEFVKVSDLLECLDPLLSIGKASYATLDITILEQYHLELEKVDDRLYIRLLNEDKTDTIFKLKITNLADIIQSVLKLMDAINQPQIAATALTDEAVAQSVGRDQMRRLAVPFSEALPQTSAAENDSEVAEAFGLLDGLNLGTALQSIQSIDVDMETHTATFALNFQGKDVVMAVSRDPQYQKRGTLTFSVDGQTYVELAVTKISVPNEEHDKPNEDEFDDYVDVKKLTDFIDPITNLLQARSYEFTVTMDLEQTDEKGDTTRWSPQAAVKLVRGDNGALGAEVVATKLLGKDSDKELIVNYIDHTIYLQFGEIKVRMNVDPENPTDQDRLIDKIEGMLSAENNGVLPDLDYSALIPQTYLDFIEQAADMPPTQWVQMVSGLQISDDGNTATIRIDLDKVVDAKPGEGEEQPDTPEIILSVTKTGTEGETRPDVFSGASVDGLSFLSGNTRLEVDVKTITDEILPLEILGAEQYQDLDQLVSFIEPITNLMSAKTYQFDVALNMKQTGTGEQKEGIDWNPTAQVTLVRGEGDAIQARVETRLFEKADKKLIITYQRAADGRDTVYLQYGDDIKMKLATADAETLIAKIQELLKTEDGKDTSGLDLSFLIPQSYVDFFTDVTPDKIVESIYSFTIEPDRLNIQLSLSDTDREQNLISFALSTKEEDVENGLIGASISGLTILQSDVEASVTVTEISDEPKDLGVDESGFVDLQNFLGPISNLLDAKTYEFDITVDMKQTGEEDDKKGMNWNPTIHTTLVRDTHNDLSVQLTVPLPGNELDADLTNMILTYKNDTVYLQSGDGFKVKLNLNDIEELTGKIQNLLQAINGGLSAEELSQAIQELLNEAQGVPVEEAGIEAIDAFVAEVMEGKLSKEELNAKTEVLVQNLNNDEVVQRIQSLVQDANGGVLPEMDWSLFLPQNYIDFLTDLTPEKVINSIHSVKLNDTTASFKLKLAEGSEVSFQLSTKDKDDNDSLNASIQGLTILDSNVSIAVGNIKVSSDTKEIIVEGADSFVDLADLGGFLDPITEVLKAKFYSFQVKLDSLTTNADGETLEGENISQEATVVLSRNKINGAEGEKEVLDVQIQANLFGQPLVITYLNEGRSVEVEKNGQKETVRVKAGVYVQCGEEGNAPIRLYLNLDEIGSLSKELTDLVNRLTLKAAENQAKKISDALGKLPDLAALKTNADNITAQIKAITNVETQQAALSKAMSDAQALADTLDQKSGISDEVRSVYRSLPRTIKQLVNQTTKKLQNGKLDEGKALCNELMNQIHAIKGTDADQKTLTEAKNSVQEIQKQLDALLKDTDSDKKILAKAAEELNGLSDVLKTIAGTTAEDKSTLKQAKSKAKELNTWLTEAQSDNSGVEDIVMKLLPQTYQDFFADLNPGRILNSIQSFTLSDNKKKADLTVKIGDDEITASIEKTSVEDKDSVGLTVKGMTILGNKLQVKISNLQASQAIKEPLPDDGFLDIFAGNNALLDAIEKQLKDHPLSLSFTIDETIKTKDDNGNYNGTQNIKHFANAFVNQDTAYCSYNSNQIAGYDEKDPSKYTPMKAKIEYKTISQLLASVLYLVDENWDSSTGLKNLAGSIGIKPEDAVRSDVLSSLIQGIIADNMGATDIEVESLPLDQLIKGITWKDNIIGITLDSEVLYGKTVNVKDGEETTVEIKLENGKLSLVVKNIYNGDSGKLNSLTVNVNEATTEEKAAVEANKANYMDFSSLNQFYSDFANTASFKEYHLQGDFKATINLFGGITIPAPVRLQVTLDGENQLKQIYGKIDVPYWNGIYKLALSNPSYEVSREIKYEFPWWYTYRTYREFQYVEIFYNPLGKESGENKIYFRRVFKEKEQKGPRASTSWTDLTPGFYHYEYVVLDLEALKDSSDIISDIMKYVYYCVNFTDVVKNEINDAIKNPLLDGVQPRVIENILKTYNLSENKYTFDLNGKNLVGSGHFSDKLEIALQRSYIKDMDSYALTQLQIKTEVLKVVKSYLISLEWNPNLINYNSSTQTISSLTKDGKLIPFTDENGNVLKPTLDSMSDLGTKK